MSQIELARFIAERNEMIRVLRAEVSRMTALPATRAEALKFVTGMSPAPEDDRGEAMYHMDDWIMLIALAKRGAETVGATEIDALFFSGGATLATLRSIDGVRRCLILPEDSPTQEETP